jgi:hypothetical protein
MLPRRAWLAGVERELCLLAFRLTIYESRWVLIWVFDSVVALECLIAMKGVVDGVCGATVDVVWCGNCWSLVVRSGNDRASRSKGWGEIKTQKKLFFFWGKGLDGGMARIEFGSIVVCYFWQNEHLLSILTRL